MNKKSSPEPVGFGPGFYDASWNMVSSAVMALAEAFHSGHADLECLKRAYVVMIAKHSAAIRLGDYRPIYVQNCSLKIIAKMLTKRLQWEIPAIIDIDET
ncbi:unnamed protein product [Urochloa humidicola]